MGGPPLTGVTAPSWGSLVFAFTASSGVFECTRRPFGGALSPAFRGRARSVWTMCQRVTALPWSAPVSPPSVAGVSQAPFSAMPLRGDPGPRTVQYRFGGSSAEATPSVRIPGFGCLGVSPYPHGLLHACMDTFVRTFASTCCTWLGLPAHPHQVPALGPGGCGTCRCPS